MRDVHLVSGDLDSLGWAFPPSADKEESGWKRTGTILRNQRDHACCLKEVKHDSASFGAERDTWQADQEDVEGVMEAA